MEHRVRRRFLETRGGRIDPMGSAAARLQNSFTDLEKRVRLLILELEEKSRLLEETLVEKESIENTLSHVLEKFENAVIAVDREKRVIITNLAAKRMFKLDTDGGAMLALSDLGPGEELERFLMRNEFDTHPGGSLKLGRGPDAGMVSVEQVPLTSGRGEFQGTVLFMKNVTRMKRLEERAGRKNRLVAMGEMAAGIAHEIRNPLGSVELFASLLKRELTDDEDKKNIAQQIISGIKHMNGILSNMLLFTKHPRLNLQPTPLTEYIRESLNMVSFAADRNSIRIEYRPDGEGLVFMDRELLKQAIFNVILNAVQAMPQGGEIMVSSMFREQSAEITICDSGPGVLPEHVEKIFNPFFSSKDRGMGLGLTIVYNIMEAHNGSVDVENRSGGGACFSLSLPVEADARKSGHA